MNERTLTFDRVSRMVGILTEPDADFDPGRPCFVLLNAGLVHRVGPGRTSVQLARRLADLGFASLRFDHTGKGRRVGKLAGEKPGSHRRTQVQNPAGDEGEARCHDQHNQDKAVVAQALASERGNEPGTTGDANGVHKKDKAKLEDDRRQGELRVDGADDQAHEEHSSHAQAGPGDLDPANGSDEKEKQQGALDK